MYVLNDANVAIMAAAKVILCVIFEEFSEPDEIGINTFLILQKTLDLTVTALAVKNKREHPNQVKGLWKLWFIIILIQQYFHWISGWKDKHFRWRIIHFLPLRLCYDLYDLWVLGLSLLLITVVVLWYCNIYHYTVGTESIQTPLNVSLFVILQPFAKII